MQARVDAGGTSDVDVGRDPDPAQSNCRPDADQIALFIDVVFSWCDGLIPIRGFAEKGLATASYPQTIWTPADNSAPARLEAFAGQAARDGLAVYVIPGTVAESNRARAEDVVQMQAVVVDLDDGDIEVKFSHLQRWLGQPTLIVESGGRTASGESKFHVWWKLAEPAQDEQLRLLCRLRDDIAGKVGGDRHFASAHQPIRVPGTVYRKYNAHRMVQVREYRAVEVDLAAFAERVGDMPPLVRPEQPNLIGSTSTSAGNKPSLDDVLTTPVREGGIDEWSRFQGASAAIGYFVRMMHEGRITRGDGWEAICGYNAAMLRPPWPLDRLRSEAKRLWKKHVARNGPPAERSEASRRPLPVLRLGALLDDTSPMPEDIVSPRVLTPGGLLVLGGAPKVGKSDFLINLLIHMAAGVPFLELAPPRPLRIFYLQAEIQHHYLRERVQMLRLPPDVMAVARDNFVATPKLRFLLDGDGIQYVAEAIIRAFPGQPPDILCIDPIRNVFDGGPDGSGENDNNAMMYFLRERIEPLRDAVAPDCGVILAHHTKKLSKQQIKDDPFLALAGASALRAYYTSGIIMHRPDEERPERRLEFELRNGAPLPSRLIDKQGGRWVVVEQVYERLVRKEVGAQFDAERVRKADVILGILFDEAAEGRIYTSTQFGEKFENTGGLGSKYTIKDRLAVLATKGMVKFRRDGATFGYSNVPSRFGYLCVEGMRYGRETEADPATGEVLCEGKPVLPTHYKCPHSGAALEVENPSVWVHSGEAEAGAMDP